ncbi:hypothetical protein E8P82_10690 [Arthrobacter echini]|uniref:ApeA N-terminal domain-containing protein n=1 Tax=Arthrobacter echini TaxID=1529066 RepID=A0A4S5E2U9_9MICC|nr:hypothetical protein [Arthrobacter echini]THJ65751.1 hypothetical protein E8P82_10690 [Arthrobacter echini]
MKLTDMKPGDQIVGFVIDGDDTLPYQHASYVVDPVWGPTLEFSYPVQVFFEEPDPQHAEVHRWAQDSATIPKVLLFSCSEGVATFYNCTMIRRKENFSYGVNFTLRPDVTIQGLDEPAFGKPISVPWLKSTMTGLGGFIARSVFTTQHERDDDGRGQAYTATVRSPEAITFHVGDCEVALSLTWRSSIREGLELHMYADAWIETTFPADVTVDDHLAIHRQMRAILALNSGQSAWITAHRVKPQGANRELPLLHPSTFRDVAKDEADDRKPTLGLTSMNRVDVAQLEDWLIDRDYWSRVTSPVLGILQRESYTAEERVIASGIAVEAIGHELPQAEEEEATYSAALRPRPTAATYMYRCIVRSKLNFSRSGHSNTALAKAFAQVYNKTKHYEERRQPDAASTQIIGQLGVLVVRAVALQHLHRIGGENLLHDSLEIDQLSSLLRRLVIADDGWPTYRDIETETEAEGEAQAETDPEAGLGPDSEAQ